MLWLHHHAQVVIHVVPADTTVVILIADGIRLRLQFTRPSRAYLDEL